MPTLISKKESVGAVTNYLESHGYLLSKGKFAPIVDIEKEINFPKEVMQDSIFELGLWGSKEVVAAVSKENSSVSYHAVDDIGYLEEYAKKCEKESLPLINNKYQAVFEVDKEGNFLK